MFSCSINFKLGHYHHVKKLDLAKKEDYLADPRAINAIVAGSQSHEIRELAELK
jgi:hypothetical protein